ncbi:hypothetical protein [Clostridium sp.]|nr:hypothetical protein [Clostridium sp.]
MAKVVASIGSPRKNGNVDTIVKEILNGVETNGITVKKFYLNDMNIRGCQ